MSPPSMPFRKPACRSCPGVLVFMNIEAFEERELLIRLEMELEIAERYKLSGKPTYTTEDVKKRIEGILAE